MNTTTDNNDLRSALESSFEETPPEQTTATEVPPSQDPPAADPQQAAPEEKQETRDYVRDELGKFASKEEKAAAEAQKQPPKDEQQRAEGIKEAPKVNQPPAAREWSTEKAPQAWKPEAREYWKDLPEPVRREVIRHAQVANDAITQNVEARRYAEAVQKTIAPFEHFIKAEGSNPIQAIDNLFSTAALLRTGNADQIAKLVTDITQQYGIGRFGKDFINKLDNALAGAAPQQENPEVAAMRQQFEQELAPLRQWRSQMAAQQQMMAAQQEQAAQQEIESFAKNAEFLNDVRNEMADIIDMGAARGVNYSLQQAYEIACRAHPEISRVLAQREQSKTAQSLNQSTQRAKQAAVSVGGAPAMGSSDKTPDSIREALELAISGGSR